MPQQRKPGARLFTGEYAPLAWSAIALVTLGAFANRSVATVLPAVSRDFDALSWFGVMSTVPMLVYVVAGPVSGKIADRRGGRIVLNVGLVIFGAGAVACAAAPTAELFILGRVLTGVGEAAFDIALVVIVAVHIPADLRPKLFAAYSTAWLLPSAFGPQLAAWIYDALTWRAVFWIIAAAVPVLGVVLWAALSGRREDAPRDVPFQVPIRYAWIAFAAGCGVVCTTWVADLLGLDVWQAALLGSVFVVISLLACLRLNPAGLVKLTRGLPSVIALTVTIGVTFEVVTAYLPLYASYGAGHSIAAGGGFLTITGICWAIGSWIQGIEAIQQHTTPAQRVSAAFILLALGIAGLATLAIGASLILAYAIWALAGVGMGLGNATLTTERIAQTPEERQGQNTAGTNLLVSSGTSGTVMLIGIVLSIAGPGDVLIGGAVAVLCLAVVSALCAALAVRVAAPNH